VTLTWAFPLAIVLSGSVAYPNLRSNRFKVRPRLTWRRCTRSPSFSSYVLIGSYPEVRIWSLRSVSLLVAGHHGRSQHRPEDFGSHDAASSSAVLRSIFLWTLRCCWDADALHCAQQVAYLPYSISADRQQVERVSLLSTSTRSFACTNPCSEHLQSRVWRLGHVYAIIPTEAHWNVHEKCG
jgi:hypothetical protein